jgi:peptidyl-prolyl cis-trans isomerase SurA
MLCYLPAAQAQSRKQSLDHIVAIVNEEVVTQSELEQALAVAKIQMSQEQVPALSQDLLQKQVLDQLINKKLQLQVAKQAGIAILERDLDHTIAKVAEQNNLSMNDLYQRLNQEGMSKNNYRNEIREQLTLQKLQQQEVVSHINITPEEIKTFMHSKLWKNGLHAEKQQPDQQRIERLLLQRKFEQAVQSWVSKLRSQAFIVTRLEKFNA